MLRVHLRQPAISPADWQGCACGSPQCAELPWSKEGHGQAHHEADPCAGGWCEVYAWHLGASHLSRRPAGWHAEPGPRLLARAWWYLSATPRAAPCCILCGGCEIPCLMPFVYCVGGCALLPQAAALGGLAAVAGTLPRCNVLRCAVTLCCQTHRLRHTCGCFCLSCIWFACNPLPFCLAPSSCHAHHAAAGPIGRLQHS